MKKIIPFLALLMLSFVCVSQNENDSILLEKQTQSDSLDYYISEYGKILSPEEINAEFVKMNQCVLRFKKINNFGYASAVAASGLAFFSLREEDVARKQSYLIGSAALGITSFVLFFIANLQLDFDNLYITPTGVVYKF